jgi:SAM-dependent methyltransferase
MTASKVFSNIYGKDKWNGGSGPGSAPENTLQYREFLQGLIDINPSSQVVDVGCGDWQIGRLLDWSGVSYVGVDVVRSVTDANTGKYENDHTKFVCLDALSERIPTGDILLVKDVFQHWPNKAIVSFLDTYLPLFGTVVVTNDLSAKSHPARVNSNIELGGWRPIDMSLAPFNTEVVQQFDYPVMKEWVKRVVVI